MVLICTISNELLFCSNFMHDHLFIADYILEVSRNTISHSI